LIKEYHFFEFRSVSYHISLVKLLLKQLFLFWQDTKKKDLKHYQIPI